MTLRRMEPFYDYCTKVKRASNLLILNWLLVRKGGFEKPFQCILNDLQGTWTPCFAAKAA
jgi:hypothetical protein